MSGTATIESLVSDFITTRAPGWLVLDETAAQNSAIRAARFYAAYGPIQSIGTDPTMPIRDILSIEVGTELTAGEWAIMTPLFILYLEFDNAQLLEVTRSGGLEQWGRTTDAIAGDIREAEEKMPDRAFESDVQILGFDGGSCLPPPNYFTNNVILPILPQDGA